MGMAVAVIATPAMAQQRAIDQIVQTEKSYETTRSFTKFIEPAELRYLVQLYIDRKRVDYMYNTGDRNAGIFNFQITSERDSEYVRAIIVRALGEAISDDLLGQAVKNLARLSELNPDCEADVNCEAEQDQAVDEIVGDLFPQYLSPSSGNEVVPANPDDIMDIVRWTFEKNDCVATETQLLESIQTFGFGTMLANNTVIRVANDPSTKVISRRPFVYKFSGSVLCP
jgi:hypothetical protein